MDSVSIGLDIGSSAVRAAEIEYSTGGRRRLRRYAQVGIPHGYVADGEIVNIPGVSAAIRRLWSEGGFSSNKVVLGVSGPRVFVRQADVPEMSVEDLRSSLKFDAQEMLPIPMEDASFDFSVLEHLQDPVQAGKKSMRILMVAAHRELLKNYLAALKGAGLEPSHVDASPLALMRAVPAGNPGTMEVIVSIGEELTTVAVRDNGVPRFIRSLTVGGAQLTETIANSMHLELAVAERIKRGQVDPEAPQLAQARKAMSVEMRDLSEDVRGTVDFFMSQSEASTIDRLLITGGASQTDGLAGAIAGNIPASIHQVDPFVGLAVDQLGLSEEQLDQARASAATAVGLALWPVESPLIRLSVLPDEVIAARRTRRLYVIAACAVAGLAGLLGLAAAGEVYAVHVARNQVHHAQSQAQDLNSQVQELQAATAAHGQAEARAHLVVTALQGDVDWVRVLGQLAAVMPSNLSLASFQGTRTNLVAGPSSSSSSTLGVGTLTFSVTGTGGLNAAKSWLLGLQRDPDLGGTWVTGITVTTNSGSVTFSSSANLTPVSESNRAKQVQP